MHLLTHSPTDGVNATKVHMEPLQALNSQGKLEQEE